MRLRLITIAVIAVALGCPREESGPRDQAPSAPDPVARSLEIAEAYVHAYFEQFPEEAYENGYPDAPADRLSDRSLAGMAAWHAKEDSLLSELKAIDPASLEGTPAAIPHAYALDRLEAAVGYRVCRGELWNVSPTFTGWTELLPSVFSQQPVESVEERSALVDRARDVPRFLDTEIANLREGVRLGYTAPGSNVEAVIELVDALLETPLEDSPFLEPAGRTNEQEFREGLRSVVEGEIQPAIRRYRDFLVNEYRSNARLEIGVAANPEGEACYRAAVRFYTTLGLSPEEIHQNGLGQMERIQEEMRQIAQRLFGMGDVPEALDRARTESQFTFRTEDEILAFVRDAIDRAREAVPEWFATVPEAGVVVRPYPAFQKRTGGGFYSSGLPGQPGTYQLGTYAPEELSRAGLEATTFHETYPGHHLQGAVVLERGGTHPMLKYFYNSGMGEGWALYAEGLADEMGLYSADIDRLGMLSNEALRAARLVVDPGMHTLGWTRDQAIAYMRENTAASEDAVAYEVDRYIAVPGQATAYLTGALEIRRLREEAEARLGERFDVQAFHDRVLENGTISLPMLRREIERWMQERESGETAESSARR